MENPKRNVRTEEIEHFLKIWLDDQVQRHIPISQAIISVKLRASFFL
jgi:hypothetical protein